MTMGNKQIEDLTRVLIDVRLEVDSFQTGVSKIVTLLTPKLQWKLEEIRHHGGDILLATVYSVTNYHTSIQVYDPVNGTAGVNWNGNLVFEGTLEECKKYCSNKMLEDHLKLSE